MEKKTLKQRIKENPGLKQAVHRFIMHPVKTRPNWWIRLFDFIYPQIRNLTFQRPSCVYTSSHY